MSVQYLSTAEGNRLAYVYTAGSSPTVMFCGGYRSDMEGSKALYLEQHCKARGQAFVRFDYAGHGVSEGKFEEGTIGSWLADALAILDHVTQGPVLLVGSSMGGWMAFLMGMKRPERIFGMIGIAAAPDFTEAIYASLTPAQRHSLHQDGYVLLPNDYSDEPYYIPLRFYEEAKAHLILGSGHDFAFPIHLLQGLEDRDVLPETAGHIQKAFGRSHIGVSLVAGANHRFSRPEDLALIDAKVLELGA